MSQLLETIAAATADYEHARGLGLSHESHAAASAAAQRAWYTARGDGSSPEVARTSAQSAYDASAAAAAPPAVVAEGTMDHVGRARSERDLATARAAGFSPAATVYQRGLRVIDLGVDNARAARLAWERKPLVTDACEAFSQEVEMERRADVVVRQDAIGMTEAGCLTVGEVPTAAPTRSAFYSLVSRLGYGGGRYLEACPPALRGANVNAQRVLIAAREEDRRFDLGEKYEAGEVVLRQRDHDEGHRETFAVVSPGYAPFDGDRVARSIAKAAPAEARGGVIYDGMRTKVEVLFHTQQQPEGFVAGEFFRVGVHVTTGDGGGNSVQVRAVVWQNLCLNMIVIDECSVPIASLRHIGSDQLLARKFAGAFSKAMGRIDPFLKAWGYARTENVVERARGTTAAPIPTDPTEAIRGIFAGLVERELVTVRGMATETILDGLVAAWKLDESSATTATRTSRAAVSNAITRAAHTWELSDPWAEDDLQRQAGALLWGRHGRAPAPLLYVEPEQLLVAASAKA